MSNWQLQDAKARFSKVVEQSGQEGPQKITRYGKTVAVVLSAEDFEDLGQSPRRLELARLLRWARKMPKLSK